MEDENRRQNRRIDILEKSVQQFTILTASVEKLAWNLPNIYSEITYNFWGYGGPYPGKL